MDQRETSQVTPCNWMFLWTLRQLGIPGCNWGSLRDIPDGLCSRRNNGWRRKLGSLKNNVIRQVGYFGLKFRCLTIPTWSISHLGWGKTSSLLHCSANVLPQWDKFLYQMWPPECYDQQDAVKGVKKSTLSYMCEWRDKLVGSWTNAYSNYPEVSS